MTDIPSTAPVGSGRRRAFPIVLKALALLIGLPLLYLFGGIVGSLIPANADWREPDRGVTIFVRTNGVHTWILLPKVYEEIDWRSIADPAHIRDPRYAAGDYIAFGFGNRDFYLNTPTWADLTLETTLAAAFGRGPGLMHVEHVHAPRRDAYQTSLTITEEQHRRLAGHIRRSFVLGPDGEPRPLAGRGYGPADVFYEAHGRYDAARTCNEWTGEALRAAGIRMGIWTPFSQSIMWRLN